MMTFTEEACAVGGGSPYRGQKGNGKAKKPKKPKPTKRDTTHFASLCTKHLAKSSRQRNSRRSYATPEQVDEDTEYDEIMTQLLDDEDVGGPHVEDDYDYLFDFSDEGSW